MPPLDLREFVRQFPENGMKRMLENLRKASEFLKITAAVSDPTAKEVLEKIDLRRLKLRKTTFVKTDCRHLVSDVLLSAPVRKSRISPSDQDAAIYILIEHQSASERLMALRAVEYVTQAYVAQERGWRDNHPLGEEITFDLVLPIIFYTGVETWSRIAPLADLVRDGSQYQRFIPNLDPLMVGLPNVDPAALASQGGCFGDLLRLVQKRPAPLAELEAYLRQALKQLESIARRQRRRWLELLSYIHAMVHYERDQREHQRLSEMIVDSVQTDPQRREVLSMVKTSAEVLMEKGFAKGEEQGLQRGALNALRKALLRQLRIKFGRVSKARQDIIANTEDIHRLNSWLDRVPTAKRWEEMGID